MDTMCADEHVQAARVDSAKGSLAVPSFSMDQFVRVSLLAFRGRTTRSCRDWALSGGDSTPGISVQTLAAGSPTLPDTC
jgi:hypothetical protein